MATNRYPNQNVNMPINRGAVQAARNRNVPESSGRQMQLAPQNGKGSRREIGNGEWIDDRVIDIGGPASPSEGGPEPTMNRVAERAVPTSYNPGKVYSVRLSKPAEYAGRTLPPAAEYMMVGTACTEITDAIYDAVEVGDVPVDPDSEPS